MGMFKNIVISHTEIRFFLNFSMLSLYKHSMALPSCYKYKPDTELTQIKINLRKDLFFSRVVLF